MITRDDMIDLLKLTAVYDQRTVGPEDVQGWLLVARHSRWTKLAAQRVIVEHYAQGAERPRVTPAQISDGIRKARKLAADSFDAPVIPDPPPEDYPSWYRAQLADHVERKLVDWADGKALPSAPAPGPVRQLRPIAKAIEAWANRHRIPDEDSA